MKTAFASALLSLILSGCLVGCGSTESKPANWTHKEMIDHLKKNGMEFTAEQRPRSIDGEEMVFKFGKDEDVYCAIMHSPQKARESAGTQGDKGLAWGKFWFAGPASRIADLKKILH